MISAGWTRVRGALRVAPFGVLAAAAAVVAASGIWLYAAEDDRGPTARLAADAKYYHAYLPSLFLDRDLDFTPQYEITRNWYGFGETDEGRPANVFGIGPAIFTAPFFGAGHAWARLAGEEADGFSEPEVRASVAASWVASLAALIPAALLIRRRLGGGNWAYLVPLLIAAAGPVVYYALRQPGYAHPFATLFVAWLVERWDASFRGCGEGDSDPAPRPLRAWLVLGALLGASALARPQCALWAAILAVAAADDVIRCIRAEPERWPRALGRAATRAAPRWLAGAAVALAVFSPQLFAWNAIYGSFYTVPQGEGFMWWGEPAWSEVLFSSRNGLLPWAPLYALAGGGLAVAALRTPRVGLALALGVALQTIANGAVWDWWAGGSFGGRRFDSTFVAYAYGLAALVFVNPGRRGWGRAVARGGAAVVGALALALAAANLYLAGQYSAPTARMEGGEPAAEILADRIPGPLGTLAGAASRAANAPARWAFAWRYGADPDAYDRAVGVHELGELYPGLNRIRGATEAELPIRAGDPRVLGASPACEGCASVTGESLRVLVGLNRRDAIDFEIRAAAPPGAQKAEIGLSLGGRAIGGKAVGGEVDSISGSVERPRRGVNELEVHAPTGTRVYELKLRSTPDPRGPDAP